MNPDLLAKVMDCPNLPSLPSVAVKVLELTQDKNTRVAEIAQTISSDQALSFKILKTVNSSFYGLRKPCSSINQAIVMLGTSAVKTLALGFSLVSAVVGKKNTAFDYQAYWNRGLITGIGAKCIAAEAGCGYDEECFLSGLLQDIGMVALSAAMGERYGAILASVAGDHSRLAAVENAELDITHADVGGMLAQRWRLPPELHIPIRFHERPSSAPAEQATICKAVALGNILVAVINSHQPAVALKRFYARASEYFALTPEQCDAIIRTVTVASKEVGRLLQVDPGVIADADKLLAQANRQLLELRGPAEAEPLDPGTPLPCRMDFNHAVIAAVAQSLAGVGPLSLAAFQVDDASAADPIFLVAIHAAVGRLIRERFASIGAMTCVFDERRIAVMMPGTDRTSAGRLVSDACRDIGAHPPMVELPGGVTTKRPITLSAGVACLDDATRARLSEPDALIDTALRALASAHAAGQGTIRVHMPKAA